MFSSKLLLVDEENTTLNDKEVVTRLYCLDETMTLSLKISDKSVFDLEMCSFGEKTPFQNTLFMKEVIVLLSNFKKAGYSLHWVCMSYGPLKLYDKIIDKYGGVKSEPYLNSNGQLEVSYSI